MSVDGDALAPTEVVDLFGGDDFLVVDVEIVSELMAHCVNESICANFVDKHHSIVRKTMFTFVRQVIFLLFYFSLTYSFLISFCYNVIFSC